MNFSSTTPVLMDDFSWKRAGDLKIGDIVAYGGRVTAAVQPSKFQAFVDDEIVSIEGDFPFKTEKKLLVVENDCILLLAHVERHMLTLVEQQLELSRSWRQEEGILEVDL